MARTLRAAHRHPAKTVQGGHVKCVVLTAYTAAITYGRGNLTAPATEADWPEPTNGADTSACERSKTLAERAAWEWARAPGRKTELVTVCPGAVLDPVLGRDFSASLEIIRKLLDGLGRAPRSVADTIVDTAKCLAAEGLVGR